MNNQQSSERSVFVTTLKLSIWLFGIAAWLFGITDRSIASLSDGYLSATDILQLFTAAFFFMSWLYLKPESSFSPQVPVNSLLVALGELAGKRPARNRRLMFKRHSSDGDRPSQGFSRTYQLSVLQQVCLRLVTTAYSDRSSEFNGLAQG